VKLLWVCVFVFIVVKASVSPVRHSVYPGYALSVNDWISSGTHQSLNSIQHLPYFSDMMAPFAALPNWLGCACWAALGFLTYATGLRAFLAIHSPDNRSDGRASQIALVCGLLVGVGSLHNNQSSVLILGCWLWAAVAVHRQKWWLAAALFAVPAFKMYTLAPALVFVALYPRQLLGRFTLCVSALVMLPFVLHPAATVIHRHELMVTYLTDGHHYKTFPFLTLYEAWKFYVGDISAGRLLPVQVLAGLAVPLTLLSLRRKGVSRAEIETHGLLLASVWCVSFGPSIEPHTYFLAAPALGWWIGRSACGPRPAPLVVAALIVVVMLSGSFLYSVGALREPLARYKIPFFGMTVFYLSLVVWLNFSHRRATSPQLELGETAGKIEPADNVPQKTAA
jgi:hypothetical protein